MNCVRSLLFALAFSLAPLGAVAQEATSSTDAALQRAYEADEHFSQNRWDEAYAGFAAAEAIAHSPVFVVYMAHCRRSAGRLLEAEALYQRVIGEELAEDAPKPFVEARRDAERELKALRARVPSVRIDVVGGSASVRLTIDGRAESVGEVIRLDPGEHEVRAHRGDDTVVQRVRLVEGRTPVDVSLRFGSAATGLGENEEGSYVPTVLALSIGGAALVAGAITGGVAVSMAGDIKEGCVDGHCLEEDEDSLDTAQTLAVVSTAAFVVGAVGIAAGGMLWLVRPSGGRSSAMVEMQVAF